MFDESSFPDHLPRVRAAGNEDAELLAAFVRAGRREGTFRDGPPVDSRSVLAYQAQAAGRGQDYRAYIVEDDTRPIGYFDVQSRGARGEVLGIYLQPDSRGKQFGRHLLRWAVADLRSRGCRAVAAEVYAENACSLRAATAAGFTRNPGADRTEDGRAVLALRRDSAALAATGS